MEGGLQVQSQLMLTATTKLEVDAALAFVRQVASDTKGRGVDLGRMLKIDGQDGSQVIMSIWAMHNNLCTFTAKAEKSDTGSTRLLIGGMENTELTKD